MDLLHYSGFLAVSIIAFAFIIRICFFAFEAKKDPIKAIIPDFTKRIVEEQRKKLVSSAIDGNS